MKFAIVDIETTGGSASNSRITEIAIFLHDGEKIIDEFCTLINPECPIPPFISRLTGISDEMVENAPRFCDVAKEIVQLTDGAVFVAHNVAFDYNFIRQEFKSLGYNYSRDYACTVRLSRKIIPGFKSYSLGNLCNNLNIGIENRHRAKGDALATVKLFELILSKKQDTDLNDYIFNDFQSLTFPAGFNRSDLNNIPEAPGVYYFHDDKGDLLYIGKSNNIKKRVISHFRNKQTKIANRLRNTIRNVSFEETGNELIALLLESEEIKKHQPAFNKAQKGTQFNHHIRIAESPDGYLTMKIKKEKDCDDAIFTVKTLENALAVIEKLVGEFRLCKKLCGVYDIAHACFAHSVNMCNGACVGKEAAETYNERVLKAIDSLKYKSPNFMIIGEGRTITEKSVVQIEKGRYMGFGYFDTEFMGTDSSELKEHIKAMNDNRDIHNIIRQYLRNNSANNILFY